MSLGGYTVFNTNTVTVSTKSTFDNMIVNHKWEGNITYLSFKQYRKFVIGVMVFCLENCSDILKENIVYYKYSNRMFF